MSASEDPWFAAVLADFHLGKAEHLHRWRIRLDCGHIHEVLTRGKDKPPAERSWRSGWLDLLPGEYPCPEKDCRRHVERDIVSWDERGEDLPPDSEDPPGWWNEDWGDWAQERCDRPTPRWKVTLACGHHDSALAEPGWKPEDGITRDKHTRRLRADSPLPERTKRWVREGCPRPRPWTDCDTCTWARKITAQEYVGPLVPPAPAKRPVPDARTMLQRRLRAAEQEAADLREQLAALDGEKS
jgi:hypothetical protein